jgi:SOS-response transcriptional repressor LexA
MYRLPVSAGVGEYLEEDVVENISIPNNEKTAEADYALRISGNNMEPKYHNGDVLLVQNAESVEMGELGIFLLDGCGFFKVYGGDTLISLNPEYGPILLKEFANVQCKGRVVGKLKRK